MNDKNEVQRIFPVQDFVKNFLFDCRSRQLKQGTIDFYAYNLGYFLRYCDATGIENVTDITAQQIRMFMTEIESAGHNPGGQNVIFRSLRAFMRWFYREAELDEWRNPIEKVRAPKQPIEPLPPVETDVIRALLGTCDRATFIGTRDRAIILTLFDTGARAQELVDVMLDDVNVVTGTILIRCGKGGKPRNVFVEKDTRTAIRAYLKFRGDAPGDLWLTEKMTPIGYWTVRALVGRRAKRAGVESTPALHAFRRAFAVESWRAGVDPIAISRMLGHTTIAMTQRYIKHIDDDLRIAHSKGSPVKNSKL